MRPDHDQRENACGSVGNVVMSARPSLASGKVTRGK
ncbi:uncharacterized protein METZ01_LOCUS354806 [marine metagenome]|uniref:Uncharacterized protein n=1 Tax=marine metagenome TaxID=408172 RepID=A0A382RXA7_9ZZZZ